jgi:hypothetical protein
MKTWIDKLKKKHAWAAGAAGAAGAAWAAGAAEAARAAAGAAQNKAAADIVRKYLTCPMEAI